MRLEPSNRALVPGSFGPTVVDGKVHIPDELYKILLSLGVHDLGGFETLCHEAPGVLKIHLRWTYADLERACYELKTLTPQAK